MPIWTKYALARRVTQLNKLALMLAALTASASALAWTPYQAKYHAYRDGDQLGHATQTLIENQSGSFTLTYQSKASWLFLSDKRKETSEFRIKQSKLEPVRYHYQRTGTGKDRETQIRFNGNQAEVNGELIEHTNALDNQLYQLAIREALANQQEQFSFSVINQRGDLRDLSFRVAAKETLSLPFGEVEALKVERVREDSSRQTFIWFAPSLDYVMVRIQQFKDGDEQADIRLSNYQAK